MYAFSYEKQGRKGCEEKKGERPRDSDCVYVRDISVTFCLAKPHLTMK